MTIHNLRSEIVSAWSDLVPISINEIRYRPEGVDFEHDDVVQFFGGKKWADISWSELMKYDGDRSACLSFMAPVAYRYYLAPYMLIALDHYEESDVTRDSAWWSLSPPDDPSFDQYWHERVDGFSHAQRNAIVHFLKFMLSEHGRDYPPDAVRLNNAIGYWTSL